MVSSDSLTESHSFGFDDNILKYIGRIQILIYKFFKTIKNKYIKEINNNNLQ